jgi:hypothetical protein
MNDNILIVLLVLLAGTFIKLVFGALRSKKAEKAKP